jgi:hypothetical protein
MANNFVVTNTSVVEKKELFNLLSSKLTKRVEYEQSTPNPICPHCGSKNIIIGAGKKPGEESRRCGDCKHFLGYTPLAKLKKARKRKAMTDCLEILEDSGIRGDLAIFTLSIAADGAEG